MAGRHTRLTMESETKYRIVADGTYDFEFWVDPQGQFVYASPSSKRITGYDAKDFINDPELQRRVVHPDDLTILDCHIEDVEKKHKASEIEFRIIHADGSIRWISHACQPVFSDEGEYLGVRGSNRDITKRKRLEEEIRRSRSEMELLDQKRMAELQILNQELRVENEERLKVEIELRESENRLRELSTALLNAQERERKLIAQEIHDSLGASLAAAKFKVEAVLSDVGGGNPQTRAALENVIPLIHGTIEEARRIQMSLRPSILDDLGILPTINWSCRQFESIYPAIRVTKEIDVEEDEVPESLKIVIYRVLQEALNNIAKHSKASSVNLLLRKMDGAIELGIQDNGQGFDRREAQSRIDTIRGLGLDSMKERTELSGGTFSIESRKGAGTVIRATWLIEY